MHRRFVHLQNSLGGRDRRTPTASLASAALAMAGLVASATWPTIAHAGKYDLDLTPLGSLESQGSGPPVIVQDNAAFRSLSSELGTIIAPKPVDPADTLGLSGFALSADVSINTLSSSQNFWQATSGGADGAAPSMQVMGRKGLWPGIEVGGGATHLFDSRMWALAGYGKIAFHEGFHHLPIPSIAIRGSFSRLLGAKDFNMTTAAPAVTVSHLFGLGKTFSLTPYVGYEALIIFSRSQVLDANPSCDEFPDAYNESPQACDFTDDGGNTVNKPASEFVFADGGAIVRHRPHVGARIIFSVIRIGLEAMFVPGGKSEGTVDGETVVDGSGLQQQYTVSVGLDF